jgi:hypothetical protein
MAAAVMARPGGKVVLPLSPEMIRNEDDDGRDSGGSPVKRSCGEQKQDCERKAAQRLLEKHGEYYKTLKAVLLGDDLYANHNTCKAVLDKAGVFCLPAKTNHIPG